MSGVNDPLHLFKGWERQLLLQETVVNLTSCYGCHTKDLERINFALEVFWCEEMSLMGFPQEFILWIIYL